MSEIKYEVIVEKQTPSDKVGYPNRERIFIVSGYEVNLEQIFSAICLTQPEADLKALFNQQPQPGA